MSATSQTRSGDAAAGRTPTRGRPGASGRAAVRTDIQGLRAIAVSLVVVYHVFPKRLSGGFTGVDVFFVISGFLITSHLLAHPPRSGRDLAAFWSRRIRRLLPASLLVLATTLVAERLVAPETQWANAARHIGAAALYVVNWVLAADSVDYLAAENAPSPVQHFWSLSVEEQFYFLWPLLILVLVGLAVLLRWSARRTATLVLTGLALVAAASLVWSVHVTATEPTSAYFVTPARIWELGAGGVLAVWISRRALGTDRTTAALGLPAPLRAALAWAGLAAIAWTAWTYTGSTPFPGWQAALPVGGTAAVIAANPTRGDRLSPGPLLALRPAQWLGDVSYSVYLWHWPLLVLVPFVSGGHNGLLDKSVIIVVTLLLAALTKRYVEDRFRAPGWGRPLAKPFVLAAAGMAVVVALAVALTLEVQHREDQARTQLTKALSGGRACLGAAALDPASDCRPRTEHGPVLPAPAQAALDKSAAYPDVSGGKDCWSSLPDYPTIRCTFGDPHASVRVALVGNSHAGQWLPALRAIAKQRGWRVDTYLASRCAMATTAQAAATQQQTRACHGWAVRTAQRVVRDHPDLVVMSNRMSYPAQGSDGFDSSGPAYRRGYQDILQRWVDAGLRVVGIHDTPAPGRPIPDCVAAHLDHLAACGGSRAEWEPDEPLAAAAKRVGGDRVSMVDLNDHICTETVCPAVVGDVVVYFDGSHLTATYNRTLAPYLVKPLVQELRAN
ncbi:MAG: acyltransferase family protein [Nocardioidaceae bacterium]